MPVTLEVEFKGLFAVIERPTTEEIRVILANAHSHGGTTIPPHTALFVAPLDDVELRPDTKPDFVMSVPGDEHFACWRVSDGDVEIDYSSVSSRAPIRFPGDLVLQGRPGAPDFPATRSAWSDKAWIPDIERILGPGQNADPALFGQRRPATATSRWPLRFGSMQCLEPRSAAARTTPFQFKPAQGGAAVLGINQVFTDRVRYKVGFDTDQIAITIGTRRVALRDSGDDGTVRAVYSNLPDLPSTDVDAHFSSYYDLVVNPPAAAQRPIPSASAGHFRMLTEGNTDCAPFRILAR